MVPLPRALQRPAGAAPAGPVRPAAPAATSPLRAEHAQSCWLPPSQGASAPPGSVGARRAAGAAGGGKGRLISLYSALPMQTWIDGMGHRINGKW